MIIARKGRMNNSTKMINVKIKEARGYPKSVNIFLVNSTDSYAPKFVNKNTVSMRATVEKMKAKTYRNKKNSPALFLLF